MTSTFHTPSFGDDLDFQPLALQQPTHVDLESGRVFAASASTAPRLSHAPSGEVPYPGGQTQPLSHLPTNTDGFNNGLNHHNPYPNHSLPNHLQHQHAQHPQHPQQQQQQHCLPKFPPQTFDIPDIQVTNSVIGVTNTHGGLNTIVTATAHVTTTNPQFYHHPPQHAHLGQVRGQAVGMANQLSPGSTHNSPGRESVDENSSDDSLPLAQIAVTTTTRKGRGGKAAAPKKAKTPKRRKKKDPNEPQKPVSAYALFFRDTQAAIKSQNPSASFGEVSKIVASMWDQLDDENKGAYKKRTELAKKEYLKQLAAYRASLVSSGGLDGVDPIGDGVPHASPSPHQPSPPRPQPAQHPIPSSMPPPVVMTTMSQPMVSLSHGNGGMGGGGGGMPLLAATPQQQQQQQQQPMMRGGGPLSQGMQMPPPTGPHGNMAGRMAPPMGGMENPALGSLSQQQQQQQHHNMMAGSPPMAGQQHTMDYFNSNQVHGGGPGTTKLNSPGHGQMCVRHGCTNPAIVNQGWDNEYCSNECVVSHCRDVFSQWVAARQGSNSYASVK